ncbi:MAG: transferase [Rhodospirillales bacterium]
MSSSPQSLAPNQTRFYEVSSLAERPDLRDTHQRIGAAAWPEFLLHDPVALTHWDRLMTAFPEWQLSLLIAGEIAAVVNAVPLRFDAPLQDLPDRGVDWGVEQSLRDHDSGARANRLLGLQVVVGRAHRGRQLSAACTRETIRLAARHGLRSVILPVRPNGKADFPLIAMADYLGWTDAQGLPYDPWLRVHIRLGGEVLGICAQSMIIPASVADWSRWTGLAFPGSGAYVVPGALVPVEIDLEQDQGLYREPNVWVVHEIA